MQSRSRKSGARIQKSGCQGPGARFQVEACRGLQRLTKNRGNARWGFAPNDMPTPSFNYLRYDCRKSPTVSNSGLNYLPCTTSCLAIRTGV